jgi:hypothetical protein
VPKDRAEEAVPLLEQKMTEPFAYTFPGIFTEGLVTAGVGDSWHAAKEDAKEREKARAKSPVEPFNLRAKKPW